MAGRVGSGGGRAASVGLVSRTVVAFEGLVAFRDALQVLAEAFVLHWQRQRQRDVLRAHQIQLFLLAVFPEVRLNP